jgi:threonine/homoserine/homoserine lactone efflux protein
MTDAAGIAAFALTSLIVELTPGPNMAYLALVAATEGRRRGYAAVAGVALGLAVLGLMAALGLATLIAASPAAYQALRWAGVAYLLWLAWDGWRGAERPEDVTAAGSPLSVWFRRGLITNLLNPKAAVFYVAVLPGFLTPGGVVSEAVMLSTVYVVVATLVHGMIVTLAGSAQAFLDDPGRARLARRALSLALAGVAVWMLLRT